MLEALWLAILQGITEFLPVSSSAHLLIFSELWDGKKLPLYLNVALHAGTLGAILWYFRSEWFSLFSKIKQDIFCGQKSHESRVLLPALIAGTLPAGLFGLFGRDMLQAVFHDSRMTLMPLAVVGILMWLVDKLTPVRKSAKQFSILDGLYVGVAQALALIPGTSRSGATMVMGRYLGLSRVDSARFSFLLGAPIMAAATVFISLELQHEWLDPRLWVCLLVSFIVGVLTIHYLLEFLKDKGFVWFAIYRCLLAGALYFILL